jgi:hypothetical protein
MNKRSTEAHRHAAPSTQRQDPLPRRPQPAACRTLMGRPASDAAAVCAVADCPRTWRGAGAGAEP